MPPSKSLRRTSGAMADIIAQGQQNVERFEKTFDAAPITDIPTDYLCENRHNPRRRISLASVDQMVNGIRQAGGVILQPLLIRPISVTDEGWRYEVICGNRRLRAARKLEMKSVPVRIQEMDDETAARYAVWENLSRENLNPMDLAESINDLRIIDGLTWDEIGERFGYTRQWGWSQQKLAQLPEIVRDLVREGELSPSNAMLLSQEDRDETTIVDMARRAVEEKMSHRDLRSVLKCKDVFTLDGGDGELLPCKDVFTWEPPRGYGRRKYARLVRATGDIAETLNEGLITPEYAQSMRDLANRILAIANSIEGNNVS